MWEHWWCMESVQQDAISTCGHLECHHIRTCETAGRGRRHWNYFYKCSRRVCNQTLLILWGCWMHVSGMVTPEEVRCVYEQINESWLDSDVFVRIGLTFTCMQNVGALRILGECSIRCHLQTWPLGVSWYWDMWSGQQQKALELFQQTQQECVRPNSVTFVVVLNACASMVVLEGSRCASPDVSKQFSIRYICGDWLGWYVCKMWEHWGCLESVQ